MRNRTYGTERRYRRISAKANLRAAQVKRANARGQSQNPILDQLKQAL